MIRGIVIPADGAVQLVELGETDTEQLRTLQEIVGGYIETVPLSPSAPAVTMFANEDGVRLQLPTNLVACMLTGRPIVGSVVLAGAATHSGALRTIPDDWSSYLVGAHD
jgi:hypothetical protein